MRIQVLSDIHTEFAEFRYEMPPQGVDALVLAGDIGVGRQGFDWITRAVPEQIPVVYVLGNHEFWGQDYNSFVEEMRDLCTRSGRAIFTLERDSINIDGVTFLGATLWTDFSLLGKPRESMEYAGDNFTDFNLIKFDDAQFTPQRAQLLNEQTVDWLKSEFQKLSDQRRVVVTHHPPSPFVLDPAYADNPLAPCLVSDRPDLVSTSRASLWICGHTHVRADQVIGSTRIISNPAGYPPFSVVDGFNPKLCFEV